MSISGINLTFVIDIIVNTIMNYLKINDFGPVKDATIELKSLVVLIGGQGTGKSTIAKLLTICQDYLWYVNILQNNEHIKSPFILFNIDSYFTKHTFIEYKKDNIHIIYKDGEFALTDERYTDKEDMINNYAANVMSEQERMISAMGLNQDIPFEELLKKNFYLLSANTRTSLYIPSERNLAGVFSSSIASMMLAQVPVPYTLMNYIGYFEKSKNKYPEYKLPFMDITFQKKQDKEGILIKDADGENKLLPLSGCSSGIQSLLPMLMILDYCIDNKFFRSYVVEEPEQNLYPENQYAVLRYLIGKVNKVENADSHVITTHSPYILSALNNLMFAYEVGQVKPEEADAVIPNAYWIEERKIVAYSTDGGVIEPIIDKELQQIEAERIDGVSQEMNEQYERLLDLKIS